jgi:hypothetical protein
MHVFFALHIQFFVAFSEDYMDSGIFFFSCCLVLYLFKCMGINEPLYKHVPISNPECKAFTVLLSGFIPDSKINSDIVF